MFDDMRSTAKETSQLSGAFMRSLEETGQLSVTAMRASGYRALENALRDEERFRALSPLTDKAQVLIDKTVVNVGLQRLTFVADLLSEGLVYPLTDPLSVTQLEWNKSSKVGAAQRTMSPSARGENKLPIVLPSRTPIYLTTDRFELDIRTLKMSQRIGMPLDTTLVGQTTRAVNEAIEDAAINGATTLDGQPLQDAGYTAPGLLNAPNANTQSITVAAWTTAPVGATVQAEVLSMMSKLQADKKFGPYNLYVGTVIGNALNTDFKANGNDSILARLQDMDAGGRKLRVRTTDMMPAATVAMVQMTSDVVEIIDGQRPTVIPWTSLDGFMITNLIMAIMIPRFRSDYDGNSGVVIGS
jgi:hypothetical protein